MTPKEVAGMGNGSTSLCSHCQSKEGEIYARSLATVNSLEQQFGEHLLMHSSVPPNMRYMNSAFQAGF